MAVKDNNVTSVQVSSILSNELFRLEAHDVSFKVQTREFPDNDPESYFTVNNLEELKIELAARLRRWLFE